MIKGRQRLTEEQNTLKEEARYVTRELNKHFESYGVVDPQLCARKRELDEVFPWDFIDIGVEMLLYI